jgi:hypothetical protein
MAMTRRTKAKPSSTKPRNSGPDAQPKPSAASPPAESEYDVEAIRYELARRLMLIVSDWRRCPKAACKRRRGCAAAGLDCRMLDTGLEMTAEETAAVMADFRRALERRRAEIGTER